MTTKPQPRRHNKADYYITHPVPTPRPTTTNPCPMLCTKKPFYTETLHILRTYLLGWDNLLISGDSAMYYRDLEGRQRFVKPDCYIAFGVNEEAIRERNGYFIEEVGKPPDFALEIASESTYENDIGPKRELYARLGIGEYWRFDGSGGLYYGAGLAGERLEDGEYRPIEVRRDADGVVWGHSPTLGLDLCWRDGKLRFYDPVIGEYLHNLPESEDDRLMERAARQSAEARAEAAEARTEAAERTILAEREARQSAESEVLQLREQLRSLQEQQFAPDGNQDSLPEA